MYDVRMDRLRFASDPKKSRDNLRKHGVSFDEAETVFFDENAIQYLEPLKVPNDLTMGRKGHECEASLRSPARLSLRAVTTKQACPFRPTAGGTESTHLRCRDRSKGPLTQYSRLLLASGSILCRREVIRYF